MSFFNYLRPTVYISVHPEELQFRHVQSGRFHTERPVVAQNAKGKCLAVGKAAETLAAQSEHIKICNPFRHPRLVIADFEAAEFLFKRGARCLFKSRLLLTAPTAILHLRIHPEGGFTQLEVRALAESAVAFGASRILVWHGQVPTDEELLSREFRSGGRLLSF